MDPRVATELEYFRTVPWCAKHLCGDNLWVLPIIRTRGTAAAEGTAAAASQDLFFRETLNTPETIAHLAAVAVPPPPPRDGLPDQQQQRPPLVDEVQIFVAVGAGVTGFQGMAHGAFLAGILDLAFIIKLGTEPAAGVAVGKPPPFVTAYLNIRYRAPLRLDSTSTTTGSEKNGGGDGDSKRRLSHMRIVVRAKSRQETPSKRLVFEAVIDDCDGLVIATAEALFVEPRAKL